MSAPAEEPDGTLGWWVLIYEGPSAVANGYTHWVYFLDADDCEAYGRGSVWDGECLAEDLEEPWEEPRIVIRVESWTRQQLDEGVDWEPM